MQQNRDEATARVINGLKKLYHTKLKPMEQLYMFDFFHSPLLTDAEFDSKPQVLMIGQYSTGKTSFIRYLLGRDFPGQRIGPEPTTDRFVAVMHGTEERVIPGNALTVSPSLPYRGLERFGVAFLNRFEGSQLPSEVLKNINIIDTPGVLSGEKQRVSRGYDFVNVCCWFAERADLIVLLFDAHKLDISDEFKAVIERLKGHDDKIRCILNKADTIDRQKLLRVYGALMWSMGKIIRTPEVLRVYVGSFWDEPLMYEDNRALFDMEENDLMNDLRDLPRNSAVRKVNELVKRCRLAKVHAYLIGQLKSQMPSMMGKEKAQQKLMADMAHVFRSTMKQFNLAPGDFPDIDDFRGKCSDLNFSKFHKLKPKMLQDLDEVLQTDIPRLMEMLPLSVTLDEKDKGIYHTPSPKLHFNSTPVPANSSLPRFPHTVTPPTSSRTPPPVAREPTPVSNPFNALMNDDDKVFELQAVNKDWALYQELEENREEFLSLGPESGVLAAEVARGPLLATGLPQETLRTVWDLSDIDKDGGLDLAEYTVALCLCEKAREGEIIPDQLPKELIPPEKKQYLIS
eukprot:489488_1